VKKTLSMLIGPKGSGKTYIGTLITEKTDIPFRHHCSRRKKAALPRKPRGMPQKESHS
jgi:replication-associated recombination protein RarA